MADYLTVSQNLAQVFGPQHISQGGLCQQTGGTIGILHISYGSSGIMDSEIHHSIYCHGHTVFC